MTEIPISPDIWKLAEAILTEKQKTVLELREKRGYSWNQLAITFNCTRSNVREIHRAATRNMLNAIDAAGGDIELALERVEPRTKAEHDADPRGYRTPDFGQLHRLDDEPEPRPASEETPEEKLELDRLWKESA